MYAVNDMMRDGNMRCIEEEIAELDYVRKTLLGLAPFYFWPNDGNLGDYLIAESTRQLFREWGISWKEYNPEVEPEEEEYNLVYGGGGRFVSHWGGIERLQLHLTRKLVRRCVILPHSIHNVDSFVKALDNRHVVFCRDLRTLFYCRGLNSKSLFVLAHDMGLALRWNQLPKLGNLPAPGCDAMSEAVDQYRILTGWRAKAALRGMRLATVRLPDNDRRIAFVLRTDKERCVHAQSAVAYDLSALYSASCRETPYSAAMVRLMAECLMLPDVVVTDRLHVAIMAMLVGKEVYMLDNDYGKLSGVYEVSLKDNLNVHLLPPGEPWPEELLRAWKKLNAPLKRIEHWLMSPGYSSCWPRMKKNIKHLLGK